MLPVGSRNSELGVHQARLSDDLGSRGDEERSIEEADPLHEPASSCRNGL